MRHAFSIAILLCAVGAECVAEEIKGPELFPLALGKRWTYHIKGQENPLVIMVSAVEKIGEFRCFKLEGWQRGALVATEHLSVRPDGIFRMRYDSADLDPPLPICKFPPAEGQSWKLDYKIGEKKASISFETEMEEITVPAGKFKAVVIRSTVPEGNGPLKNSCWYAPKIGMVRQVIESEEGKVTLELIEEKKKGLPK